jgi:hypothetical protein
VVKLPGREPGVVMPGLAGTSAAVSCVYMQTSQEEDIYTCVAVAATALSCEALVGDGTQVHLTLAHEGKYRVGWRGAVVAVSLWEHAVA